MPAVEGMRRLRNLVNASCRCLSQFFRRLIPRVHPWDVSEAKSLPVSQPGRGHPRWLLALQEHALMFSVTPTDDSASSITPPTEA